ncbi:MAG: FAD-dependent oxidoreductase [Lachnospiraceae bacterium]
MEKKHEILFTPMKIGGITIKNRIVLSPMGGTNMIEFGAGYEFNQHCYDFYIERAKNDVGLMIPGMVLIKNFQGQQLYESEKTLLEPLKNFLDEIHSYGSKVFIQIGAGMGRTLSPVDQLKVLIKDITLKEQAKQAGFDVDKAFAGPSAGMPNAWDPEIITTELPREEILDIIDAYGKASLFCKKAGFDGIEVHAVHEGYLLDQFAISATNKRTDEFGGSIQNRLRYTTDIIKSIKASCGKAYPVSVRYSVESKMIDFHVGALPGEEFTEFGRNREDSKIVAQILEDAGADLLNADNGSYDSWYWAHPPVYMPLSCNLDDVTYIKKYVKIPVVCAGRMENPDTAAEAVCSKKIDGVGIGRQLLCDAEYVTKIKSGNIQDIRPCIACHNGCLGTSSFKGTPASMPTTPMGHCALNPATLSEHQYKIEPAEEKKNVVVIGGGIGGMEAARLCAVRGHNVSLYEKSGELGGVFIAAAAPVFKEKDKMLIEWYKNQLNRLAINIHMNTEIKTDDLNHLNADEVIIATGAKPRKIPVKGAERKNVMEAVEYLRGTKSTGQNVVIIGGGLTGCEIAYDLVLQGKAPVIIEMQDDILKVLGLCAANSNMLRDIIRYYKIPVRLETKLTAINDKGVIVETPRGEETIPADSVIMSVGYIPQNPFVKCEGKNIHILGDAYKVGNLKDVVWRAYDVALSI